jgi:hypothetical protein
MATRYTGLGRSILPLSSWVGGGWSTIPSRMGRKMSGIGAKLPRAEFENSAAGGHIPEDCYRPKSVIGRPVRRSRNPTFSIAARRRLCAHVSRSACPVSGTHSGRSARAATYVLIPAAGAFTAWACCSGPRVAIPCLESDRGRCKRLVLVIRQTSLACTRLSATV